MPARPKLVPMMAKAKPISKGGSASVITYLRREKKTCVRAFYSRRKE